MTKQIGKHQALTDIFEIARQTGVCLLPIRVGISTNFHKGRSPAENRWFCPLKESAIRNEKECA